MVPADGRIGGERSAKQAAECIEQLQMPPAKVRELAECDDGADTLALLRALGKQVEGQRKHIAALTKKISVWQPIETAPKKGEFMVWIPDTDMSWPAHACGDRIYSNAHGLLNEEQYGRVLRATHWMPLPAAPGAKRT